jgi:hypothetical protein
MKTRKNYYLPEATLKQIEEYARSRDLSNSVAVQMLIDQAVEKSNK